jgi:hypothetical protein
LDNKYSVYKFDPEYTVNINILPEEFISITRTKDELSIVAQQNKYSDFIKVENNWKMLKINGILDFALIEILSKISTVLAKEDISIFVISTYNTDYIIINEKDIEKAIEVLLKNGYKVKE